MTTITTEGSARPWGGVCEGFGVSHGAKSATLYPDPTLQKRPPVGRVGRCPAVPSGGSL